MKITFLDGSSKEFQNGMSAKEIAQSISPSLAKKSIFALVNQESYDITRPINSDATLELKMKEDSFSVLNHSCAHLLASAVKALYPDAQFGVGPAIEEGFYYDINPGDVKFTEDDLPKIEAKMLEIAKKDLDFVRREIGKEEGAVVFKNDKYKMELLAELPDDAIITTYTNGDYTDLCRGPHVENTKYLLNFKLTGVSGAYWKGDSKNEQLQRVYGVCFFTPEELKEHLNILEERKKRDHRKLGKELGLFMLSEYGPGFPFWLPNGMILKNALQEYWYKVHAREGYKFVQTPMILNRELWETSGHWMNYRENMYTTVIDDTDFAIKPMNCPGGMLVYKNDIHSYKDLPLKVGELGLVHRHEASGALNGLFRVRCFTQDDAHIFMRRDQIAQEVCELIRLYDEIYSVFNLSYHIELSTRPEDKYIGSIEVWNEAEAALAEACKKAGKEYIVNPGDGAFYGPKLDFKLRDSMNRIWQCGTIQLDMNLPERFDLSYIDEKGEKVRPIMLHRALLGSFERFIGIITEHFGGAFPTWLSPIQVRLIPVNNQYHLDFVKELEKKFKDAGIRVDVDAREEKLGYKIREAQTKKIPYQLVIGDNEVKSNSLSLREYGKEDITVLSIDDCIKQIKEDIESLGKCKK